MKYVWGIIILNSALLVGAEFRGVEVRSSAYCDLKSALIDDYCAWQKVADRLPPAIQDTCYRYPEAVDSCAALFKLLSSINKVPSAHRDPTTVENIKKNTAAIAEIRQLSPQTINQLVANVLDPQKKADDLPRTQEQYYIQKLYDQFPSYLGDRCSNSKDIFVPNKYENISSDPTWNVYRRVALEPICYRLALLLYGLSPKRDMNGVYHEDKKRIKENIKKVGYLPCFKTGLYTEEQLVADFIKAGESSKVEN
jgi:hypothetical protein